MLSNYFFLNRFIVSEQPLLHKAQLTSITSQESNTYVFTFTLSSGELRFWETKLDGLPYLIAKQRFSRAKKNVASFYEEFLPAQVTGIYIAEGDRVFKIACTTGDLHFYFKGNSSALLFTSAQGTLYENRFRVESSDLKSELLASKKFTDRYWFPHISQEIIPDIDGIYPLKQIFVGFGKEIQNEYQLRCTKNKEVGALHHLSDILNEVYNNEFMLGFTAEGDLTLVPSSFISLPPYGKDQSVLDPADAMMIMMRENGKRKSTGTLKKELLAFINEKIRYFSKKIDNSSVFLREATLPAQYKLFGDLLSVNREYAVPGSRFLQVQDIISGTGECVIPLKSELTVQQNIDYYYKKAKNSELAYSRALKIQPELELQLMRFTKIKDKIEGTNENEILSEIAGALGMKTEKNPRNPEPANRFRKYLIEGKYYLYVGKDAHNNDELTVKFAKQNDIWFHARSVPGSHCVLRVDDTKNSVPKEIIKKAASIAAFHSKAKSAKLAPVSFAEKKFVVKRRGLNPGQVMLLKEQSIIVPPEIPLGCEPIGTEPDF